MRNVTVRGLLGALASVLTATVASAAFTVSVTQTSALPAPPASFGPSSATNQPSIDILPGAPQLFFGYDIVNNPSDPLGGSYTINGMQFFYSNSAVPIDLTVTITETAANFIAPGSLNGVAIFEVSGAPNNTFGANITFSGSGANTINFPVMNTSNTPVLMFDSTNFTSLGATGTITTTFNITLQPFSNMTIGNISGVPFYGFIGVNDSAVPVPATALMGIFAIPVLARLRRRMAR